MQDTTMKEVAIIHLCALIQFRLSNHSLGPDVLWRSPEIIERILGEIFSAEVARFLRANSAAHGKQQFVSLSLRSENRID